MLHITNGDCAFGVIAGSGVGGDVVAWRDVLDDRGEAPRLEDDLVLWFEHDLYDQLQLLEVLATAPPDARVQAIVVDEYLGELDRSRGPALWRLRRPVEDADRAAASEAWRAFTSAPPDRWSIDGGGDVLRFAAAALRRMQQDLPWTTDGLALTERRLLEPLLDGPLEPAVLFDASQRWEEPKFLGDTSAFWRLDALAPLVANDNGTYRLTADGEAVLAGKADRVELAGFDRWLGGTHVRAPDALWRWDAREERVVSD